MTFLLFAYAEYYPEGGFNDYVSTHTNLDAAKDAAKTVEGDHFEVVRMDLDENNIPTFTKVATRQSFSWARSGTDWVTVEAA